MELSGFWMYDSSLVREPPKGAGQTMGGLQLAKPTPLAGERAVAARWRGWCQQKGEGSGGRKESGCHGKGGGGPWRGKGVWDGKEVVWASRACGGGA